MLWHHCGQASAVETGHPARDGIAQLAELGSVDRGWRARPGLIEQPFQAPLGNAPMPVGRFAPP